MSRHRDYKKDVVINEHDLEEEWINQPSLYLYYAEAHADAIHIRDMKKAQAEYVYATMYSEVKSNWDKYFDTKPTEAAIKEHVLSSAEYRRALKAFINASKDANLMLGAKTAFDHRKRALENLVSLKIAGFHSEPSERRIKGNLRQVDKKKYRRTRNR